MCSGVRKNVAISLYVKGNKARESREGPDLRKLK